MMKRKRSPRQRGVTLMEMVVVVAIFSVIFIISYSLLEDTVKTSLFVEEHNDLPIYGQTAVNTIQRELLQARVVFEGTTASFGPAYFSALTFPTSFPLLTGSQMPILNPTGTLVPDTGTQYTGNCLLIARQLAPAAVTGLTGGCSTPPCTLMVDRYQFEVFYLTKVSGRQSFAGLGYYLDAISAKSAIFADYTQLTAWNALTGSGAPTSADHSTVASKLSTFVNPSTSLAEPTTIAWDPSAAEPSAFYTITSSLGFTSIVNPKIVLPNSAAVSLFRGALGGGRTSGKMAYTVGFRRSATQRFDLPTDIKMADGTIQARDPVPKYAGPFFDANFPSGMEFLMVGPAGSRRILSRVVLMAQYIGYMDSKDSMVITSGSS